MATLISVKQVGSFTVRAKWKDGTASGDASASGVLAGKGRNGFVTKQGNTYCIFEANARRKGSVPEAQWAAKKSLYKGSYC